MQIALAKKLADAMGVKPSPLDETISPLFSWTANWVKVWDNRRVEDMIVLVNNATRFTVAIYQVKRNDLKNVVEIMKAAISNTLLYMNLNPELVEEYMSKAGKTKLVKNNNRHAASWVTRAGLDCSFYVGRKYNGIAKMFCDTIGVSTSLIPVNYSGKSNDGFIPYQAMINELSALTEKQAFKYRAFELLVTLDLEVYKATRRIIVPADLEFTRLPQCVAVRFWLGEFPPLRLYHYEWE